MSVAETKTSIDQLAINTIRTLSMDAVQKANSGHPGTPMALAPVTYQLWQHNMRYDPSQPMWPARDRFILSCGHASMLLYSILHLTGVRKVAKHDNKLEDGLAITLDDIKNFRQLHSPCAGHPEFGEAAGIETTTGPLGQGVGTSVGVAMAAKFLAAKYNRPGFEMFENRVFVLCSDGDLMEGISDEAASVAGHLKLNNLLWIYDHNTITIEGHTHLAFSEDVATRFEGYGWNALQVDDANDLGAIQRAIDSAKKVTDKPSIIVLKSVIGYGSPNKANTHTAHGAPLGADEIKLTKKFYGWPEDAQFHVPDEVRQHFAAGIGAGGKDSREQWEKKFADYAKAFPKEAVELKTMWAGKLPDGWDKGIPTFPADPKGVGSRISGGKVLNGIAKHLPWMIGGSADLAPSTMTLLDGEKDFSSENYAGRNLHFGIREHGMAAICNGLSLCGLRPFGATFFVFTDYLRPALRLSAIMHRPVIQVLTHDSIGLGEDGPTHQPIEHLSACRVIPNLDVVRPGDANEVAECYRKVIQRLTCPAAVVLSRQNLPTLDRTKFAPAAESARGGYILAESPGGKPQAILIATGSELDIAVKAWEKLVAEGIQVRLVSMPCVEWFDEQDEAYRANVLPRQVTARVVVEAGARQCWDRFLGEHGVFVGMTSFGASAPYDKLYKHFGITPEHVAAEVKAAIGKKQPLCRDDRAMPLTHKSAQVEPQSKLVGQRVDRLVQQLAGLSRSQVIGLFDHGCVMRNGAIATQPAERLAAGDQIDIRYDANQRYHPRQKPRRNLGFTIVFEDKHLIVVEKPAELLTVPTRRQETNTLQHKVEAYVKHVAKGRGAFAVHRLDRGVSGLLVFGKTQEMVRELKDQFAASKPEREYLAIVAGLMKSKSGTFKSLLATDKDLNRFSTDNESIGQLAITHYRVVAHLAGATAVQVRLETGRRNQIRVHFAEAGHPVLGEERYEVELAQHPRWPHHRLALHARLLGFEHPVTGHALRLESPLPAELERFLKTGATKKSGSPW